MEAVQKDQPVWNMKAPEPIYVVDIIGEVAAATSNAVNIQGIPELYYMHGHPLEIITRLQEKTKNPAAKDKRFPLIALFQDFKEERGGVIPHYGDVSLNMALIHYTKPEYDSTQRYEKVFKPVLYPMYYQLLNQFKKSKYIEPPMGEIKHDKWDRLFWGKTGLYGNTGNIFNDYIDAIELMNVKLKLNNIYTSVC